MRKCLDFVQQNIVSGDKNTEKILLSIIIIYCIVVSVVNPAFFQLSTVFIMIRSIAGTMVIACGLLLVVISGGIDVSFTAVAIFGGYSATRLMIFLGVDNIFFAFFIACTIGLFLGLFNAIVIHITKLEPFIITLATSGLFHGSVLTFVGTRNIGSLEIPRSITRFGQFTFFTIVNDAGLVTGLSGFVVFIVVIVLLTWFILYRTMLGKSIFALGCSAEVARRAGFNVFKTRLFIYGYAGVLGGMMGMLYVAELNSINPVTLVGTELMVIAAVIIGGARVSGGQGTVLGTVLGVMIMYIINNTLIFLGITSSWNSLFLGAVLLSSMAMVSLQERRKNRKTFIFTE